MKAILILIVFLFSVLFPSQVFGQAGKFTVPDSESKCEHHAAGQANDKKVYRGTAPPRGRHVPYVPPVAIERKSSAPSVPVPPSPSSLPSMRPGNKTQSPVVVNVCDAGGCWDSGGNRYSGGTGDTYLNAAGKPCQRMGTWMQCN